MSELENGPTGDDAERLGKATTSTDVNDPERPFRHRGGDDGSGPGSGLPAVDDDADRS